MSVGRREGGGKKEGGGGVEGARREKRRRRQEGGRVRVVGEEEVRGVRGMETAYWAQWSQSRDHRLRQYCIQKGRREVSAYILGMNTHLHETPLYSTRAVRMVRALAPKAACRSEETLIDLGEGCVATV